ncbi:uncharacterized protein PGTG_21155 [Puccinia graminis f. sp. tritici CRL 75-36-700-3]|uniref:Secreted protein n=1 Tax=Puccinia graminis f. sp. tritici (strain CRL 75-36-700-3 / race SCCL) TaxID=418459 RepID=H6QQT6_PUCGT|nr:uncharacterized protein PGTG_21155 [Puccinia graminis f. sp. tritici CRL 75-36-700-3]EHS62834.1 hypothetical protein PGTG_21155 [Puccinia graminis f. sp. tritici CRL 75-36-700-3]
MNLSVIATIAVLSLVLSGICNAYGPVICDSCKTYSAHEMTCELSKNGPCGEVIGNGPSTCKVERSKAYYQCTNQDCGRWYTLNREHDGQDLGCDHVNKCKIDPPEVVEMCPPAPQPVNYLGNAGNIRNPRLAN